MDHQLADVRTRIAALYARHACEIADALGEKPLCIVTGPRRFGKTTSLLPCLARTLRRRGNTAYIMNGRDYEHEPLSIHSLPVGQFDVLIIDEANVLTQVKTKTENLLRLLHTTGNSIVLMFTFDAGYEPGTIYSTQMWRRAEFSISGQVANVVCLPQMVVSPQLARDLLSLYSPIQDETIRLQVMSYIVERVPLNPHVLLELSGANSIADVNTIVRQRKRTLFQRALSPDEYRELEKTLRMPV
jgi:hypothetical protein